MNENLASNRLGYPSLTERLKQKKVTSGGTYSGTKCLPLTFFALCVNQTRQEIIIQ